MRGHGRRQRVVLGLEFVRRPGERDHRVAKQRPGPGSCQQRRGPAVRGRGGVQFYDGFGQVVVRKGGDGSLWAWGSGRSLTPTPYVEGGFPVTASLYLVPTSLTVAAPEFVAADGTFHMNGSAVSVPIACP